MRKQTNHSQEESDVDMTPMLDIVFIMLIFFIVTTSFMKESGIDLKRPSEAPTPDLTPSKALVVEITPLDEVTISGRLIDIESVRANVERALSENPNLSVMVKTDEQAGTGLLVRAVDQVKLAGITQVTVTKRAN